VNRIKSVALIAHGLGSKGFSGEKKVYIEIARALKEKSIPFKVLSFSKPSENINNHDLKYLIPFNIDKFDKYQRLLITLLARRVKAELYINASGTLIPLSDIGTHIVYSGAPAFSRAPTKYSGSIFWKLYLLPFEIIMKKIYDKNAIVISNSYYSKKLIEEEYNITPKYVIYPPIDIEFFERAFHLGERENAILTISRIERGKMIENTITIAKETGLKAYIVGSLRDKSYFLKLKRLAKGSDITFLTDISNDQLLEVMKKVSIYFHPTIGEHFGMPVVEAMSAGLIPIVPKESGSSEVVPEFSYRDIYEAIELVKTLISERSKIRREMRERAKKFNSSRFREEIASLILQYY
jgi:glycosyltransferase involved in cell wall biosynthesis